MLHTDIFRRLKPAPSAALRFHRTGGALPLTARTFYRSKPVCNWGSIVCVYFWKVISVAASGREKIRPQFVFIPYSVFPSLPPPAHFHTLHMLGTVGYPLIILYQPRHIMDYFIKHYGNSYGNADPSLVPNITNRL